MTKHQISSKLHTANHQTEKNIGAFGDWIFSHWLLFGVWNLVIGYFSSVALFCFVPKMAYAATGVAARTVRSLESRAAPAFLLPQLTTRTLANGMRCYFLPDHTLPLFSLRIVLPAGSSYDPPEKVGLNGVMLGLLRSGGTTQHSAQWIDERLDEQAISLSTEGGLEVASITVSALRATQAESLALLTEVLYAPAFAAERVALAKGKILEGLRRQNDQPNDILQREFRKVIYGASSPWARTPARRNIAAITVEDLRAAHVAMLNPEASVCAAAGDIDPETLVATLNRLMAAYPITPAPRRPIPPAPTTFVAETRVVPKSTAQAALAVGHRGSIRTNPDRYALVVMNEILGSPNTLSNWLTSTIRTERGLVYGVWSNYGFGPPEAPGLFQVQARTRPEKVGEVIQLIREGIARMAEGTAVTEAELANVKASLLKRIIFEYEEPFNIVAETARFVYFGFPADYITRYRQGIAAVTLADVRRVAKQYLHPEAVQTLVVGNPQQMGDLGTVKRHRVK